MKICFGVFVSGIRLWARSIASILLKRECICCHRELRAFETDICTSCLSDLPDSYTWAGKDSEADKVFWGRCRIEKVTSLFLYCGRYKNLLYSIKYRGNFQLASRLGKILGNRIPEFTDIDYIIPVPLHPKKKRRRGYNQSELISKGIAISLRKTQPLVSIEKRLIKRKGFTPTQTNKDRADRWENVRNAFTIDKKRLDYLQRKAVEGKPLSFLIVDDVLTTGATLDACASLLHKHCRCRISIATLAYVP